VKHGGSNTCKIGGGGGMLQYRRDMGDPPHGNYRGTIRSGGEGHPNCFVESKETPGGHKGHLGKGQGVPSKSPNNPPAVRI